MSRYTVPASEGKSEYVEKRSSFLGRVQRVSSEEEAKAYIAAVRKEHRDARHNCWCYILSSGIERYSDDGEPQGTAGLPMLEIFRREGVTDAVCVVTRYFGGILLGAGGLFRAYVKAAKDALEDAGTEEIIPRTVFLVPCPYSLLDKLLRTVSSLSGTVENSEYGELVTLKVSVPSELAGAFSPGIFDASSGAVKAEVLSDPSETGNLAE